MSASMKPKTGAQVREEFRANGVVLSEWCAVHQIDYQTALDVLHGRSVGVRGEAHRAAVALGIKRGRVVSAAQFTPGSGRTRGTGRRA